MRAGRPLLLDAVRGLAVVSVVAYHCFTEAVLDARPDGLAGAAWWPLGAGSLGVDLFFVLSGFLLVGSWERCRRRHPEGLGAAVGEYARSRALRILPAYWVSLVAMLLLAGYGLAAGVEGPGELALLATVQGYVVDELPRQVNLVYWSLTTEVHFYLLLPAVAWALRRYGARRLLIACVAAAVAWRLGARGPFPDSWIIGRLDQFVAGMAAAGVVRAADAGAPGRLVRWLATRQAAWCCGGVLALVALYHGAGVSSAGPRPLAPFVHPVAGLAMAALLIRVLTAERPPAAVPVLTSALARLGLVSFSLYLWHFPVINYGLARWGLDEPGAPAVEVLAGLAVLLAVAGAISVVSYQVVERPFLERKGVVRPPVLTRPVEDQLATAPLR